MKYAQIGQFYKVINKLTFAMVVFYFYGPKKLFMKAFETLKFVDLLCKNTIYSKRIIEEMNF